MRILLDTSALAKRYKREDGCQHVDEWLARADGVVLAAHGKLEIASAFLRDLHANALPPEQYRAGMAAVTADFAEFEVLPVTAEIEAFAIAAMQRTGLRAMDALHIGTAQAARVDRFVTADARQAEAAQDAGVKTEKVPA